MNKKKLFTGIVLSIFLSAFSAFAFSLDIKSAKDEGLVGETGSGYLASPQSSPAMSTTKLIEEINDKRKAKFSEVGKKQGISADAVAKIFAKKAYEKTEAGHYVQSPEGSWVKK